MVRRRIASDDDRGVGTLPALNTYCGECYRHGVVEIQHESPGGATCKYGHGGADGVPMDDPPPFRSRATADLAAVRAEEAERDQYRARLADGSATQLAREGDTLHVRYGEVKLGLKGYSSVTLGGDSMTVTLREGEDVGARYEELYEFLRAKVEGKAREKVALYAAEIAKAQGGA